MSSPTASSSSATKPIINKHSGKPFSATYLRLRNEAERLPVRQHLPAIISAIKSNQVVILVGQSGVGKTTQVAKELVDQDSGIYVVLTQNRRVAADSIASRIASELDVHPGTIVGLKDSDRDLTSVSTRLDVMTDGMLLAMAKSDPGFQTYRIIIIDDAHAHSIATDFLMGLVKLALVNNSKLKVVVMSATMNKAKFLSYFPGADVQDIPSRAFTVNRNYLKNAASMVDGAVINIIIQVHLTGRPGNILVFVSGEIEINDTIQSVKAVMEAKLGHATKTLEYYRLFGAQSAEEQDHTVSSVPPLYGPDGMCGRKLIVAANIAETSVTLTGVTHVIDTCKAKRELWNIETESWSLEEYYISKSDVALRSERAGRTSDGESYVLLTEYAFQQLPDYPTPDILKGDMVQECLQLLACGMNPITFPYVNPPASETVAKAMGTLASLILIEKGITLTDRGNMVESFGIDAQLGVALVESVGWQCSDEIIAIAAMVEETDVKDVFISSPLDKKQQKRLLEARARFKYPGSDHLTLLNIYMAWKQACADNRADEFVHEMCLRKSVLEAADTRRKILLTIMLDAHGQITTLHGQGREGKDFYITLLRCLAAGNYLRVAKRNLETGKYEAVPNCQEVSLEFDHNHSGADSSNEWVFFHASYD